jgi:hypothetical protein
MSCSTAAAAAAAAGRWRRLLLVAPVAAAGSGLVQCHLCGPPQASRYLLQLFMVRLTGMCNAQQLKAAGLYIMVKHGSWVYCQTVCLLV